MTTCGLCLVTARNPQIHPCRAAALCHQVHSLVRHKPGGTSCQIPHQDRVSHRLKQLCCASQTSGLRLSSIILGHTSLDSSFRQLRSHMTTLMTTWSLSQLHLQTALSATKQTLPVPEVQAHHSACLLCHPTASLHLCLWVMCRTQPQILLVKSLSNIAVPTLKRQAKPVPPY